jgi:hypothetical protein
MNADRVWPQLYKAALFGWTPTKFQTELLKPKRALVSRARELFHSAGDNIEEEQAVNDAMYALNALRSALRGRPKAKNAPPN